MQAAQMFLHTCSEEDSSHFAFSAASRTLCKAMLSFVRSTPDWKDKTWNLNMHTELVLYQTQILFIDLSLEFLDNVSEEMLVKILSSQEGVTISGLHFKNSLLDLQDWDIKCTSTQVIHSNTANRHQSYSHSFFLCSISFRLLNKNLLHSHFILGFVQTIGQSSSCGLIDHTQDIQTCNLTCIFGSLKSQKYIRYWDVLHIHSSDHSISEIICMTNSLNSMLRYRR